MRREDADRLETGMDDVGLVSGDFVARNWRKSCDFLDWAELRFEDILKVFDANDVGVCL